MEPLTRLAIAAQQGDRSALNRFVTQSQGEVWRLCARLVGRDAADDVTQDTYVRAIAALPAFRHESSARTWLLSIARRACADLIRQRQRRRRLFDRVSTLAQEDQTPIGSSLDIDELVAQLDEDRRIAFMLTQELGLSYEEAAVVCACPIGTIRSRVARARRDLAQALTVAEPPMRTYGT